MGLAISVILPTYNEAAVIEPSVRRLSTYLSKFTPHYEIVVVDDGSEDETRDLPWTEYRERYQVVYLRSSENEGKGGAVRRGLQAASNPLVFFTDIDLPIELESLRTGFERLDRGDIDFVIGNRRMRGSQKIGKSYLCRRAVSIVFNLGVRLLAVRGCSDTQCCMKGFTAEALARILPMSNLNSFAFDVELIFIARQLGLSGEEYAVQWRDMRGHPPHFRLLRILISNLRDVACLRLMSLSRGGMHAYRDDLE